LLPGLLPVLGSSCRMDDAGLGLLGRSEFDESFHGSLELQPAHFGDEITGNLGTSQGYSDGKFRETATESLLAVDASSTDAAIQTNQNANASLREAAADHCSPETRTMAPRKRPRDECTHGFGESVTKQRAYSSEKKDSWDVMYERLCAYKSAHGVRFTLLAPGCLVTTREWPSKPHHVAISRIALFPSDIQQIQNCKSLLTTSSVESCHGEHGLLRFFECTSGPVELGWERNESSTTSWNVKATTLSYPTIGYRPSACKRCSPLSFPGTQWVGRSQSVR
jgi:hypothetical protein